MGVRVAENPAGAVNVEHDRQRTGGALGAHDADGDVAVRAARDRVVGDVDLGLVDVAGLDLVDDLAALDSAEVEQVGRVGGGVSERLGGRLEHDRGRGRGRGRHSASPC